MKKILSILMILVLVSGAAFAQVEPKFSGSATLSWGIDLGYGTDKETTAKPSHGFLNEASASVSLPFVKSGASKGEGDVYAFIDLSGVGLGLSADMDGSKTTGKIGKVSAKVVFYGGYVTLYNAPDMTSTHASDAFSFPVDDIWGNFTSGFEGFGTKIGYANKDFMDLDVGLKFVSNGSWKDRDGKFGAKFIKYVEIKANRDNGTGSYYVPAGHEIRAVAITIEEETKKVKDENGNTIEINIPKVSQKVYVGPGWKRVPSGTYALYKSEHDRKDMNGQYGFGLDFHMVPLEKYLTVDANFNITFVKAGTYQKVESDWDEKPAMNLGIKLASEPIEGLNIALGFDGGSAYKHKDKDGKEDGVFAWALGFGTDYTHKMVGTVDFGMYVASKATPYGKESVVDAVTNRKDGTDMAMTFGYKGLPIVKGLDLHARLNVFQLFSKISDADKNKKMMIPLGINFGASYKANITDSITIKPYFDIWGESNAKSYYDDTPAADKNYYFGLAYKLGVSIMPLERLTIDLNWSHGKPFAPAYIGTGYTLGFGQNSLGSYARSEPIQHKADNGRFVISAKITY